MRRSDRVQKKKKNEIGRHTLSSRPLQDITQSVKNNELSSPSKSASTPNSSQESTASSTPQTSPLRSTSTTQYEEDSPMVIRRAKIQAVLSFGINERKQCHECGMSYLKNIQSDIKMHNKYHSKCMNGRDWNNNWGKILTRISSNEYIVTLNLKNTVEVKAALELLEIVNRDLNAPDDNEFWLKGEDHGKVFLYIKDRRAIGIVSMERITQGKWFSIEDGIVVNNSIDVKLLAGISRVYVCNNHRRLGIGMTLLATAQKNLIYGMAIPHSHIGWSQPSTSGGKLARAFNGRKHKSGKILIPVYT